MKVIINEDKLLLIKENEEKEKEEVTFYKFFTEVKNYLKKLLEDPIGAEPGDLFKDNGISKSDLLNKMLDRGIIKKKENIDEPNDADGKMKSMHYLSYSIPKKDFEHKIKRLYDYFFDKPLKESVDLDSMEKAFTPILGREILERGINVVRGAVYPDKFYYEGYYTNRNTGLFADAIIKYPDGKLHTLMKK